MQGADDEGGHLLARHAGIGTILSWACLTAQRDTKVKDGFDELPEPVRGGHVYKGGRDRRRLKARQREVGIAVEILRPGDEELVRRGELNATSALA